MPPLPWSRPRSRLTTLNASAVGAAERWDAELNYLRQVMVQQGWVELGQGSGGCAAAALQPAASCPGSAADLPVLLQGRLSNVRDIPAVHAMGTGHR